MKQKRRDDIQVKIYENRPQDFNPHVEVAACYVELGGNFLWLKRAADKPEGNMWGVPGGKFEVNENPEEAAVRELFEETGITIDARSQLHGLGALYVRKPEVDYIYHLFQINMERAPTISLSAEHLEYTWASLNESKNLNLMAGAEELLHYYLTRKRRI